FAATISSGVTATAGLITSAITVNGVTVSSGGIFGLDGSIVLSGGTLSLASGSIVDGVTVSAGGKLVGPGEVVGGYAFGAQSVVAGSVSGISLGDVAAYYDAGLLELQ